MPREASIRAHDSDTRGFRWRSDEISRIEGLSDAVFAFAVTLLIVSLEVPRTFGELYETMRGFLPFAISFAMLVQIWYIQFGWFRRYGLQDTTTVVLNSVLLFVVLFYVYPLKFLFTYLVSITLGGRGVAHLPDGRSVPMMKENDAGLMMLVYDAGFIAVFTLFVLLYLHAWRKRDELKLNVVEQQETITRLGANLCFVAIGLASFLIVMIGGTGYAGWSGMVYMLIAPVITIYYTMMGRRRRTLG